MRASPATAPSSTASMSDRSASRRAQMMGAKTTPSRRGKGRKPALRGQQEQRDGEGGPGDEPDPEGRGLMRHGRVGQARQQSAVGYDEEEVAPALEARVACKLGPYGEAHCRLLGCVASWPAAFGGRGGGEALRQPVRLARRFVFGLRRLRKDDSRIRGHSGHEPQSIVGIRPKSSPFNAAVAGAKRRPQTHRSGRESSLRRA